MSTSNTSRKRIRLAEALPLRVPLMIYLESTNMCNFSCGFCPTGNKLQRKVGVPIAHVEDPLFEKIISDLKSWTDVVGQKIPTIGLFWMGEPLMNPKLASMIRTVREANVAESLGLSTNASLLSPSRYHDLLTCGLDVLSVSFYGTTDTEYSAVHKNFTFNQVVSNIRGFKEERDAANLTSPTIVGKFFEPKPGIEELMINQLGAVDKVAYESPFNWSRDYSEGSGNLVQISKPGPMSCCPSPWFVMAIGADGLISGCCSDWAHKAKLGDVRTTSLYDIWNGERMIEFRRNIVENRQEENEACQGCTYYKVSHDSETNLDALFKERPDHALSVAW